MDGWGVQNTDGGWLVRCVSEAEACKMFRKNRDSHKLVYEIYDDTSGELVKTELVNKRNPR